MNKSVTMRELASVIGEDATEAAIEAFSGRTAFFPKKRHMAQFNSQEEKETYIKNLFFKAAYSAEEIAAKMDLSVRYVRDIIRK